MCSRDDDLHIFINNPYIIKIVIIKKKSSEINLLASKDR